MMGACVTNKNNRVHCNPQPKLPDDCLKLIFEKLSKKKDRDSFGLTCHNFLDIQNSCPRHLDFRLCSSDNVCANHQDSPIQCRSKKKHDTPIRLFNRFDQLSLTSCDKLLRLFHRFDHVESLSLTNADRLLDSSIKKLEIYLCRLHSLDLSGCSYVTDKGLTSVASNCRLLSVIRLRDCKLITDKGLNFLTKICKTLKQVDLSGCSNITDTGIGYINRNCRQLRALKISGCHKILGVGFQGFSKSLASLEAEECKLDSSGVAAILSGGGLEYLNLSFHWKHYLGAVGLGGFDLEYLHLSFHWKHDLGAVGLGGFGANIKVLEIVVTNDAIMKIAKGCPLLQEWNLSNCYTIDVSGWESIGLYCQNLKTIHVINNRFHRVKDELMDASLIALSHCRRLSVIYMCIWWHGRKRSPHEIRDVMMRKDVKIIEYKEVSKNTISWDNWGLQYDSKMKE